MQPQGGGGDQPLRGEKVRQEGVLGMGPRSVGPNWNGVQDGAHPEREGRQLSEEVHHLGHEKELWKRKGQGRREDSASAVDRRDRDAPEHVEAKRWSGDQSPGIQESRVDRLQDSDNIQTDDLPSGSRTKPTKEVKEEHNHWLDAQSRQKREETHTIGKRGEEACSLVE